MVSVLVTGANGQLGSEIKKISENSEFKFYFTDIETLDISKEALIEEYVKSNKINWIINCAAYTAVDLAEKEIQKAELINVNGTRNIAKIAVKYDIKIIHISTDFVYDGENNIPYDESDKATPLSFYGKTKLYGEMEIKKAMKNYIIIRTSWLYSSYGKNFVKTIINLAKEKEEINVVFDQIGTPTYANDLADCIIEMIKSHEIKGLKFTEGIYHYSNEGVASWYDFAKAIVKESKIKCKINPIETKDFPTLAKRPNYSVLNKKKIREKYNIEIPYWLDSLENCINIIDK